MAHSQRSEALRPRTELPMVLRRLEVSRVETLSPHLRRLVFTGPELIGKMPWGEQVAPLKSPAFDDHCKLFIPPADGVDFPRGLDEQGVPLPPPAWLRGRGRHYTIRKLIVEEQELWIDIVLHEGGLVSQWAAQVAPGAVAYLGGPRASAAPASADWYVFAADHTALPAVERWLEEQHPLSNADVPAPAHLFLEVQEEADRRSLTTPPNVNVTWLVRGTLEAATAPLLQQALGEWCPPLEGEGYAWIAGESGQMRQLRALVEQVLPSERVEMGRYWSLA